MKFVQSINRGALGAVLAQGPDKTRRPLEIESLTSQSFELLDQQIALVWSQAPHIASFPDLIVVNDGMARDFLAWSNTFLTLFKPITSHLRVLEKRELLLYESDSTTTKRQPQEELLLRQAGIGLMLGEMLSTGPLARSFRQSPLPVNILASGLSFAALRTLWIGNDINIETIANRWSYLRQLTKQPERPLSPKWIVTALRVLSELTGQEGTKTPEEKQIHDACLMLVHGSRDVESIFKSIPEIKDVHLEPNDTREVRVSKFEAATQRMLSKPTTRTEFDSFAIGFLANELHPGTLTYVDLVYPLLQKLPSALMWYGLCAGLSEKSNVPYELGGVGLRAWREVSRPDTIFSRPTADLSLLELDVLLSSDRPSEEFATMSGSSLTVELAPAIWSVVSMTQARQRRTETGHAEASASRDEWRANMDEQVNALLARISDLVGQLAGRTPPRPGSSQQDFFSDSTSSKRKRNRR